MTAAPLPFVPAHGERAGLHVWAIRSPAAVSGLIADLAIGWDTTGSVGQARSKPSDDDERSAGSVDSSSSAQPLWTSATIFLDFNIPHARPWGCAHNICGFRSSFRTGLLVCNQVRQCVCEQPFCSCHE